MAEQGLNIPGVTQALNISQTVADNVVPDNNPVFHGIVGTIIGLIIHAIVKAIIIHLGGDPVAVDAWIGLHVAAGVTLSHLIVAGLGGAYLWLTQLHQKKQQANVAAAATTAQAVANTKAA